MFLVLLMIPLKNVCEAGGLPGMYECQPNHVSVCRKGIPRDPCSFFFKENHHHAYAKYQNKSKYFPLLKSTSLEYSLEISLPKPSITYCATSCCYRVSFYIPPFPDWIIQILFPFCVFLQILALCIIQLERIRGCRSSVFLFLFWVLSVVCSLVPLRAKIQLAIDEVGRNTPLFVLSN